MKKKKELEEINDIYASKLELKDGENIETRNLKNARLRFLIEINKREKNLQNLEELGSNLKSEKNLKEKVN